MCHLFVCEVCGYVDSTMTAPAPVNGLYYCVMHHPLNTTPVSRQWHGQFERERYNPEFDIVCNRTSGVG